MADPQPPAEVLNNSATETTNDTHMGSNMGANQSNRKSRAARTTSKDRQPGRGGSADAKQGQREGESHVAHEEQSPTEVAANNDTQGNDDRFEQQDTRDTQDGVALEDVRGTQSGEQGDAGPNVQASQPGEDERFYEASSVLEKNMAQQEHQKEPTTTAGDPAKDATPGGNAAASGSISVKREVQMESCSLKSSTVVSVSDQGSKQETAGDSQDPGVVQDIAKRLKELRQEMEEFKTRGFVEISGGVKKPTNLGEMKAYVQELKDALKRVDQKTEVVMERKAQLERECAAVSQATAAGDSRGDSHNVQPSPGRHTSARGSPGGGTSAGTSPTVSVDTALSAEHAADMMMSPPQIQSPPVGPPKTGTISQPIAQLPNAPVLSPPPSYAAVAAGQAADDNINRMSGSSTPLSPSSLEVRDIMAQSANAPAKLSGYPQAVSPDTPHSQPSPGYSTPTYSPDPRAGCISPSGNVKVVSGRAGEDVGAKSGNVKVLTDDAEASTPRSVSPIITISGVDGEPQGASNSMHECDEVGSTAVSTVAAECGSTKSSLSEANDIGLEDGGGESSEEEWFDEGWFVEDVPQPRADTVERVVSPEVPAPPRRYGSMMGDMAPTAEPQDTSRADDYYLQMRRQLMTEAGQFQADKAAAQASQRPARQTSLEATRQTSQETPTRWERERVTSPSLPTVTSPRPARVPTRPPIRRSSTPTALSPTGGSVERRSGSDVSKYQRKKTDASTKIPTGRASLSPVSTLTRPPRSPAARADTTLPSQDQDRQYGEGIGRIASGAQSPRPWARSSPPVPRLTPRSPVTESPQPVLPVSTSRGGEAASGEEDSPQRNKMSVQTYHTLLKLQGEMSKMQIQMDMIKSNMRAVNSTIAELLDNCDVDYMM